MAGVSWNASSRQAIICVRQLPATAAAWIRLHPPGESNQRNPTSALWATPLLGDFANRSSNLPMASARGLLRRWPMASAADSCKAWLSSPASFTNTSTARGSASSPSASTARCRIETSSKYSMLLINTCNPSGRCTRANPSAARNCVVGSLCLRAFASGSTGPCRSLARHAIDSMAVRRISSSGFAASVPSIGSTSVPRADFASRMMCSSFFNVPAAERASSNLANTAGWRGCCFFSRASRAGSSSSPSSDWSNPDAVYTALKSAV